MYMSLSEIWRRWLLYLWCARPLNYGGLTRQSSFYLGTGTSFHHFWRTEKRMASWISRGPLGWAGPLLFVQVNWVHQVFCCQTLCLYHVSYQLSCLCQLKHDPKWPGSVPTEVSWHRLALCDSCTKSQKSMWTYKCYPDHCIWSLVHSALLSEV